MQTSLKRSYITTVLKGLLLTAGLFTLHESLKTPISKAKETKLSTALNQPQYFMGYHEIAADIYWLQLIEDSGYCENPDTPKAVNTENQLANILTTKLQPSRCNKGWAYHMVDAVTELAPRFRYAYRVGAVNLSVAVDDREGAKLIFDKGTTRFPGYWELAFDAAYHYIYEIQDPKHAADLLLQANRHGSPSWLPVLASRLYSSAGRKALGQSVLEEYLKTEPTGDGARRAKERLDKILSEPDI